MRAMLLAAWAVLVVSCGDDSATEDGGGMDAGLRDVGAADSPPADRGEVTGWVEGVVLEAGSDRPIAGARVTLVEADGTFGELRSATDGAFAFPATVPGDAFVGASSPGRAYVEQMARIATGPTRVELRLGPEAEGGRWTVVGNTLDEFFAGTPSATVMPDGRVIYCHNTQDAVLFDPRTGDTRRAAGSPSSQGCHMQTVLSDGRILFVGGQDPDDPASFVRGIRYVKTYDPAADRWEELPLLNEPRWYPTLIRLADERMLACGGGQPPDARRTATCEIFDPGTSRWTPTGSLERPTEYSPSALLLTGEVLTTWYPPQLFDPSAGTWRATGDFVQQERGFPDHSDHSLVLLADGTALAIGIRGTAGTAMVERYDPGSSRWSLGASPESIRMRPEVVLLPDGRVLCAGGKLEETDPSVEVNPWDQVRLADLYDPASDTWRSVAPMILAREYHALTVLVPDGRVLTTSGTSNQATGPTDENTIEAFEPPYLFRGPRPRIDELPLTDLVRGTTITVRFSRTAAPTAVVLLGTNAVTHWMEGGVPRLVRVPFTARAGELDAMLPADRNALPPGYYTLFLMVDDIPSEGVVVRVAR